MIRFVFITPVYNCEKEIEQTIISVVGQTYKNWKMVIVNDLSTDSTLEKCKEIIKKFEIEDKVEIVDREEKFGEVRNTLTEVKRLNSDDVVVRLDGADWLTDLGCLTILNEIYEKHDPAALWTAHRWNFSTTNISGPIDPNISLYHQEWRTSHLKTFRVKDFVGLNHKNFTTDDGRYIMIACDQAIFLPLLERARRTGRPLVFLPKEMYHYDIDIEREDLFHNDRSYEQKYSAEWIRSRGYIE